MQAIMIINSWMVYLMMLLKLKMKFLVLFRIKEMIVLTVIFPKAHKTAIFKKIKMIYPSTHLQ